MKLATLAILVAAILSPSLSSATPAQVPADSANPPTKKMTNVKNTKRSSKSKKGQSAVLSEEEKKALYSSTNINFDEARIEGRVKTPKGTYLKARKNQNLEQMVDLRKSFNEKIQRSASGVRSLAK